MWIEMLKIFIDGERVGRFLGIGWPGFCGRKAHFDAGGGK